MFAGALAACPLALGADVVGVWWATSIVVVCELLIRFGIAPTCAGLALCAFPPGIVGRYELSFAVAFGALFLSVVVWSSDGSSRRKMQPMEFILVLIPVLIAISLIAGGVRRVEILLAVLLLSVVVSRSGGVPEFCHRCLGVVALLTAALSASYVVTATLGLFANSPLATIRFNDGQYLWNTYFPFTNTVGGTRLLGDDSEFPRLVILTSEPGLSVFFICLSLAYYVRKSGRSRLLGLTWVLLGAVATQSMGVYISVLAGAFSVFVTAEWRKGRRLFALMCTTVGALAILRIAQLAVDERVSRSAQTVGDRGLSGASTLATGNVNLIVGIQHFPLQSVPVIVALVLTGAYTVRYGSDSSRFFYVATLCTAVFTQPIQFQFGAWVMIAMLASIDRSTIRDYRSDSPTSASGGRHPESPQNLETSNVTIGGRP